MSTVAHPNELTVMDEGSHLCSAPNSRVTQTRGRMQMHLKVAGNLESTGFLCIEFILAPS
jgi:hypothetical protein